MARIKRSTTKRARHKKVLQLTKGYRGTRSKLFRVAKEAMLHAGQYAYAGRRLRKRDKRAESIVTISAALENLNVKYSNFIHGLKEANISLDRKVLSQIASQDPKTFEKIVEKTSKVR